MDTERRVLVIYTGGTIGMIKDARTGILAPFDFLQLQEQIPELRQLSARVEAISFDQPIDSSNMDLSDWVKLAELVRDNYQAFDGFVILHGSDTMAYTASALSFMMENLAKPVILTGSQLPIGVVRTDGKENFITAIEIAADYRDGAPMVPEVAIYFEYQLYRGNRTYKYNAEHFMAFRSPNCDRLAQAGVSIAYNKNVILEPSGLPFAIDTRMDNRVAMLSLFPGISHHIVDAGCRIPDNKLLIIRTYGSGNALTASWFLEALDQALSRGLLIANVSQCRGGGVSQGRYETSAHLERLGVMSGKDMMIEAALTKSMRLLGMGLEGEAFANAFTSNMRGELTTYVERIP